MVLYAYDIYSGFIEDTLNVIGSRDMTLVERFQRLGDFSQNVLGLPYDMMEGWQKALEKIIMEPPESLTQTAEAVALLMIMRDAGQRRFRIITEGRRDDLLKPAFSWLGHEEYCGDFIHSEIAHFVSPNASVDWGYLDVNQVETLLLEAMGNDSFKKMKTAVIAGRLSNMARPDAEHALIDVGIETQNSISHNIDYLILGSKGTGGSKFDKVKNLKDGGRKITVLDEEGFEALLHSPKKPPENWSTQERDNYEELVRSLRHIWAFGLDMYCLSFRYDPEENTI